MAAKPVSLHTYRSPQTLVMRFVTGRTIRSAVLWALVFGMFVAGKAAGFATAYPTVASRAQLALTFGKNIGMTAILGSPLHIETVAGFTVWNTMSVMMIIGALWAVSTATKIFRGAEDAGQWEFLLSGQTTAKRAALNALAGLGASLATLYVLTAVLLIGIGRLHSVDYGLGAGLFYALAACSGALEFMAIGALTSQLMPTRGRATGTAVGILGLSFVIRAAADVTSKTWLLSVSPLGWIEKLQPLANPQPLWLIPIFLLTLLAAGATVLLADQRDLGDSTFADKDTSQPHTRLLNSTLAATFRLTRSSLVGWLLGITWFAFFFGTMTKSAAQAFSDSVTAGRYIDRIVHATQNAGATTFLGIVFFMVTLLIMCYAASAVGAMWHDESEGYLDNLLVRPVSRLRWYSERISLAVATIAVAGALTLGAVWVAIANQGLDINLHTLLLASLNALAPALFILGLGLCTFGLLPRLSSLVGYATIAWSFFVQMLSSGVNLDKWVLNTSLLYHISLAPATDPNWHNDGILVALGIALALIGAVAFHRRDLQKE